MMWSGETRVTEATTNEGKEYYWLTILTVWPDRKCYGLPRQQKDDKHKIILFVCKVGALQH